MLRGVQYMHLNTDHGTINKSHIKNTKKLKPETV